MAVTLVRVEAALKRRVGWWILLGGMALAAAGPAPGQDAARALLERAEALAAEEPGRALEAVEALLASGGLSLDVRREAARLRPRLLADLKRPREAAAAWERLLAQGEDVAAELLALSGARLEVAPAAPPRPGEAVRLDVAAAATGPLTFRLYRVDAARLRAALADDPTRGLFAHLRAPPPAGLRKLAEWSASAEGAAEVTTPVELAAGVHLLTVTARQVTLARPLLVAPARVVVRRGVGPGVLFCADAASGAPRAGVTWTALDAEGRPREPLGTTDAEGLLRFAPERPWASAWLDEDVLLVAPLPSARAEVSAAPAWRLDLPAYRPGQRIRARVAAGPAAGPRLARVIDPRGVTVVTTTAPVDAAGAAHVTCALPPAALPGRWRLAVGEAEQPVEVLPPLTPEVVLSWAAPPAVAERALRAELEARLDTGAPLSGAAVRWVAWARPAAPPARARPPGPLAPWALEPAGPAARVGEGAVVLDAEGRAEVHLELPAGRTHPGLVVLEASLVSGALRAAAAAVVPAGAADLVLAARPQARTVSAGSMVEVELAAADLAGAPSAGRELLFTAWRADAPEEAGPFLRRALRAGDDGTVKTFVSVERPGTVRLVLAAQDPRGRPVRIEERLFVVAPDPPAAERTAPRLLVEPGRDGGPGVVGLLPFERGHVLLALVDAAGVLRAAATQEVRGGVARWSPPLAPGEGGRVALTAVRDDRVLEAEVSLETAQAPLAVAGRVVGYAGEERVALEVTTGAGGAPAPAAVTATLYDAATARLLARGDVLEGEVPPLAVLDAARTATAADGAGRLVLTRSADAAGRAWVRLEATDAAGRRGAAWVPLPVTQDLSLELLGPRALVEGDQTTLVARVRTGGVAALLPETSLRVSWAAEGLDVGTPVVLGGRTVLAGDPGLAALRLAPAEEVLVAFPLEARRSGSAALNVRAALEGTTVPPRDARLDVAVRARGLREHLVWTGAVPAGERRRVQLDLPRGAVHRTVSLEVAVDPAPATALLGGLRELARPHGGLRAPLQAELARAAAARAFAARRLAPRGGLPPAADWTALTLAVAAAAEPDAAWGPATGSVLLALARLAAEGRPVPAELVAVGVEGLARRQAAGERLAAADLLALAAAGRGDLLPPDDHALAPDDLVLLARARDLVGPPEAAAGLLDAALAAVDAVASPRALAELLVLLGERRRAPEVQARLVERLLLARDGSGWDDLDAAGAALLALADVVVRSEERPGSRALVDLEEERLLELWSGGGLAEWPGPAQAAGTGVGGRAHLFVEALGPDPVRYAARVDAVVRTSRRAPRSEQDFVLERQLLEGAAGGSLRRVGLQGVAAGTRLVLVVTIGEAADLGGTVLEVPLPAGCAVLDLPPGAVLDDGVLLWEPDRPRLELELLARLPGDTLLLPVRLRDRARAGRTARTGEELLRIVPR